MVRPGTPAWGIAACGQWVHREELPLCPVSEGQGAKSLHSCVSEVSERNGQGFGRDKAC